MNIGFPMNSVLRLPLFRFCCCDAQSQRVKPLNGRETLRQETGLAVFTCSQGIF